MNYNELSLCANLLGSFPFKIKDRTLPAKESAEVLLLAVRVRRCDGEFKKIMDDVLATLKTEGFDERLSKYQRMTDIEKRRQAYNEWSEGTEATRPDKPTNKELKEAKDHKADTDAFEKELKELDQKYRMAYNKQLEEEAPMIKKLSVNTFEKIVEHIGFDTSIEINAPIQQAETQKIKISGKEYLELVGRYLVYADK